MEAVAPKGVKHKHQDQGNLDAWGRFLYVTGGWRTGDPGRLMGMVFSHKSILFSCELDTDLISLSKDG